MCSALDVLMPAFRARRTVPYAVRDVLAQRDVDLRLIAVVDRGPGGDDDGTREWLRGRAREEPRLVVVDGPGRGLGAALDVGLARATAPLVGHMEADDRCPPDRFARLVPALEVDPALDAMTSRAGQIGTRSPGMARYLAWQNALLTHDAMANERFVEIPALHQTGVYRRQALLEVGGYAPRGPWPPDIDFWLRWFEHGRRVAKLPRVLYRWRQHARQSTRTGARHDLASLRAAKVAALSRHLSAGRARPRPVVLLSTGRTRRDWERDLRAAEVPLRAVHDWKPGLALPDDIEALRERARGGSAPAAAPAEAPLLLCTFGVFTVRARVRALLAPLAEPGEVLFVA